MSDTPRTTDHVRLLIAHGEAAERAQVRMMLQDQGYELQEVATSRLALAALETSPPDLLLLDPLLGDPERPPLLTLLQDYPLRATMAVLVLAPAHLADAPLLDAADQILVAPFAAQPLRLAIHALLHLKAAERAARELHARQSRDQQTLQQASFRLAATRSLPATLHALADTIRCSLGYDRVSIALFDPATATLRNALTTDITGHLVSTNDLPPVNLAPGSPLRDLPAYQALFDQGQDLFFLPDSATRIPAYFRPYLPGPVRQALLVPLRTASQPIGLFTVDNLFSKRPFGPDDVAVLLTLAGQAALALERVRLAEALDARVREAETIAQVGTLLAGTLQPATLYPEILALLRATLPCDLASLLFLDQGWATVQAMNGDPSVEPGTRVFPITGPAGTQWPLTDEDSTYIRNTDEEGSWRDVAPWTDAHRWRSVLYVPLHMGGADRGALLIVARIPDAFAAEHLRLVRGVAERLGLAQRAAYLYAEEQARAREAEELARMRSDFVASVSHELRTPLTAIMGFSEMLQARWHQISDRERLTWIDKIVTAASRQQRLVEDLLMLTRMERGTLTTHSMPASLRALCIQAAEEVERNYRGQRIDLIGPEQVIVQADAERTVQVLTNLMDNAAKYSPEGSPIIVWWGAEGAAGVVRVLDRGPGIAAEGRTALFTRFGRVPGSRMRAGRVGTGLGLYIGRQLAHAMGGEIELESTGEDGSTFAFHLPLATPDAADGVGGDSADRARLGA